MCLRPCENTCVVVSAGERPPLPSYDSLQDESISQISQPGARNTHTHTHPLHASCACRTPSGTHFHSCTHIPGTHTGAGAEDPETPRKSQADESDATAALAAQLVSPHTPERDGHARTHTGDRLTDTAVCVSLSVECICM